LERLEGAVMRALLWMVIAVAVTWGGYWFVGARALETGALAWFRSRTEAGLVAEHGALSVSGFPNRFDLTVTDLRLADPGTGYGWTAPFVQVLSLSYKPWHIIAVFANQQQVRTPWQDLAVASDKLQGSVVIVPGTNLALDRLTLVGDAMRVTSDLGWTASVDTLRFATEQVGTDGTRHEIGLELLDLEPDPSVTAGLPDFPKVLEKLRLDAVVTLTAPLDRRAGQTHPRPSQIDVKEVQLVWGSLVLFGTGSIAAAADGVAEGRIALRLTNWREAIPLAVTAGLIKPEVAPTWENMFALLAAQTGDPGDLDLPLVFARGRMSLGPLPLGPAPRMN
jgi:hypothetical protein